ncbi:hypothetical protein C8F04DRAFT_1258433 [Mycena alexandri]|uniref:Uncharacterized protein n=1 Tax=Mycena alexandri TaxID=1745969 RepID=A0AAD6SYB5_9AGAR|nr:hypothetical protein C8F04DRAFT_1258433 [Mycena alexandri]
MTPTAGDKARAVIQRRAEKLRRKKHALAQAKYRERNTDTLREKARESMKKSVFKFKFYINPRLPKAMHRHRAAIKESEERTKAAREQRREVDTEYRERQRQKDWIKKFGQEPFERIYVPLSRIHGHNTSRLPFVRGTQADADAAALPKAV